MKGVNHRNMNDMNRSLILGLLLSDGPISRAELSRRTGLSRMAVTDIINSFMEDGTTEECGEMSSSGGRKPKALRVKSDALLTLAVSIGRREIRTGIVNTKGEILFSERASAEKVSTGRDLVESILELSDSVIAKTDRNSLWGIGISCAGPLSVEGGKILNPPNFSNIRDVAIADIMKERYGLPCWLQNDMCVAALAENYFARSLDARNFFYIGISDGIGGGIVIDGKLYTGATGLAGIIGHTIVEPGGIRCECGQRGCLEKYASMPSLLEWARKESRNSGLTWQELSEGLRSNDRISVRTLERLSGYLETAVINLLRVLDTECIVIGGDLGRDNAIVASLLEERLHSSDVIWSNTKDIRVVPSEFTESATLVGASALVMEKSLSL